MNTSRISINTVCIIESVFLFVISVVILTLLYVLTGSRAAVLCGLLLVALVFLSVIAFIIIVRQKLTDFSDCLCMTLDNMLTEETELPQSVEEESLFYKISHRLNRLYEVMREQRRSVAKERADLQELITDISHQVKTPIANLKMVDATLLEQDVPKEKQHEFLQAMGSELDKLDFLMQAMIKTSRLETGIITLKKKCQPVYDTLAATLGGIILSAEKKNINVYVECPEKLVVSHDCKWTGEALFNILDNAVKYTQDGGSIYVAVSKWEFWLRIDITDTGKGIPENIQGAIFKRFYRETGVHDESGVGIGLYLAREIITMQGGYIKVTSKVGEGSMFSVFLPCEENEV